MLAIDITDAVSNVIHTCVSIIIFMRHFSKLCEYKSRPYHMLYYYLYNSGCHEYCSVHYSHVWVIAVRLSSMDSDVLNTSTDDYLTRAAFRSYSDAMDNEPYIVAEIDANNYPATFALGDSALTFMYSDFPNLDFNGPLMEGTLYSYFVRFFSPRPQVNHVIRYSNCVSFYCCYRWLVLKEMLMIDSTVCLRLLALYL